MMQDMKKTKAVSKRKEMKAKHFKCVDDMTLAQAINLKEPLEETDDSEWIRPRHITPDLSLSFL